MGILVIRGKGIAMLYWMDGGIQKLAWLKRSWMEQRKSGEPCTNVIERHSVFSVWMDKMIKRHPYDENRKQYERYTGEDTRRKLLAIDSMLYSTTLIFHLKRLFSMDAYNPLHHPIHSDTINTQHGILLCNDPIYVCSENMQWRWFWRLFWFNWGNSGRVRTLKRLSPQNKTKNTAVVGNTNCYIKIKWTALGKTSAPSTELFIYTWTFT